MPIFRPDLFLKTIIINGFNKIIMNLKNLEKKE